MASIKRRASWRSSFRAAPNTSSFREQVCPKGLTISSPLSIVPATTAHVRYTANQVFSVKEVT